MARGREALIDELAAGQDAPRVFLQKVRSASKDVAGRGMTSFEGEAIRKAKLALNKAIKKGYNSITDRFNRDNTYACSLSAIGQTRRSTKVMDCLTKAYLPDPGRSTSQRKLAIGSNAIVNQNTAYRRDDIPHSRIIYFRCATDNLCAAGLTSTPDDAPLAFTWYGAVLSFQDFVHNIARCPSEVRLQTFGHGTLEIGGDDRAVMGDNMQQMLQDELYYADEAANETDRKTEASRRVQPKYAQQFPPGREPTPKAKGKGKGKGKAANEPRPSRDEAEDRSWTWTNRDWGNWNWDSWQGWQNWQEWQNRGWQWR